MGVGGLRIMHEKGAHGPSQVGPLTNSRDFEKNERFLLCTRVPAPCLCGMAIAAYVQASKSRRIPRPSRSVEIRTDL